MSQRLEDLLSLCLSSDDDDNEVLRGGASKRKEAGCGPIFFCDLLEFIPDWKLAAPGECG